MFVQNLNAKQQAALLYMAKVVAHADGNMDELQLGMMEILAKQAEAGVKEMVVPLDELPILFDTERVAAVHYCLSCWVLLMLIMNITFMKKI